MNEDYKLENANGTKKNIVTYDDFKNIGLYQTPYLGEDLQAIYDDAISRNIPVIPPETAGFLQFITAFTRPTSILELGCAVGFSSSLMAKNCLGAVTTIERFDVMIEEALKNFKKLQLEQKVMLLQGDATEIVPKLLPDCENFYDLIFMDCGKAQYINLLPDCIRLLKAGGILITDDIMQNGLTNLKRSEVPRRQRTTHKRMREFLHSITNTDGLFTTFLPLGDGIAITHKIVDDVELAILDSEEYDEFNESDEFNENEE